MQGQNPGAEPNPSSEKVLRLLGVATLRVLAEAIAFFVAVFVWLVALPAAAQDAGGAFPALLEETVSSPTVAVSAAVPAAALIERSAWKRLLREQCVRPEDAEKFRLHLEPPAGEVDATLPVVILVHGLNSKGERNGGLLGALQGAGLECGVFDYPNDHGLDCSAALLSHELARLKTERPNRPVAIVTHSMGGLIARAVVEDPQLDPGNVRRLVMIAPPNHGTHLAKFAYGTDCWEHLVLCRGEGSILARWRASVADGLGEAVDDMQVCSPFLTQLNARERNKEVRYTIVLGTGATMSSWQMALARKCIRATGKGTYFWRDCCTKTDSFLAEFDEVMHGRGDGVVALKRGRLDGVPDTHVLEFGHLAVTDACEDPGVRAAQELVLARLREKL